MKFFKKLKKIDFIFIITIVSLLLLIGIIHLFTSYTKHQAEIAESQSIAAIENSIEESKKAEAESLEALRNIRPSSELTDEAILTLDNTDNEFWFNLSEPHTQTRTQIMTDLSDLIDKYEVLWIGEDNKNMYLTMDLGYEYNDNVTKILDIAKEKNIKINFFLTGDFLEAEPAKVKRMYDEGHLIGNHTMSHFRAPDLITRSLEEYAAEHHNLEKKFTELTGGHMSPYIRPPYGAFSERTLAYNQKLGYYTVFWSYAYLDWDTANQMEPTAALDHVKGQFHNGEIFLLHTISNTNVEILPEILESAKEQGYQFKRLDERFQ